MRTSCHLRLTTYEREVRHTYDYDNIEEGPRI